MDPKRIIRGFPDRILQTIYNLEECLSEATMIFLCRAAIMTRLITMLKDKSQSATSLKIKISITKTPSFKNINS